MSGTGNAKDAKEAVIQIDGVVKAFDIRLQTILVLKDIRFSISREDFLVIFGPSGCGKSTLLHVLLGLEPPTKGKVIFFGKDLYAGTSEDDRAQFRKEHIGTVYQQANWIKSLSVLENVAFPLMLVGENKLTSLERAFESLRLLKMDHWADYSPSELSGGQQQRAALARAMITQPDVIFADGIGKTIVMVTHDMEYIKYVKSAVNLRDGRLEHVYRQEEMSLLVDAYTFKHKGNNVESL